MRIPVKDKNQYKFIRSLLEPHWTCLDIGANVGLFTVLMAKRCKQVYAFEPDTENYRRLVENTAPYTNCKSYNCIVAEETGYKKLYRCETSRGMHRIYPSKWCVSVGIDTNTISIDSLSLKPDFIKIDVEGSELGVLKGMTKTIKRSRPKMVIEFHPPSMEEYLHNSPRNVYDFLKTIYPSITLLGRGYDYDNIEDISFERLMEETSTKSSRNIYVSS